MKKALTLILLLGLSTLAFAADVDRSTAKADVYGSASMTFGIDFETMDAGIENEAALNLRFPLIDSETRTTKDQGDFYGQIELKNLSFRLLQSNLSGPAKPGDSPTSLNAIQGQFGGNVADWLGNKPFSMDARLVYNPFPYTKKLALVLFSEVAQTEDRAPGTGLSFNKAEAVTTPLFKTYTGVKLLGEIRYDGMDTSGAVIEYQGPKLRTALKAFSHNETPFTARIPAWKDHEDKDWALGADLRYDFVKDWTFIDCSAAYDFRDSDRNINAGLQTALTVPLGWGEFAGFRIQPAGDLRYGLEKSRLNFDARLDLIALLSDADRDDKATMLMSSLYLGDDRDFEYAVIFSEPLAGGWIENIELGCIFSAMDILGNNPKPLPGISQDYGPSAQYGLSVGWQADRKNVLKAEGWYQTGLASYFASANEDGLFLADSSDRALLILTLQNTFIPNTQILAIWTSGNLLTSKSPLGVFTVQTKVTF